MQDNPPPWVRGPQDLLPGSSQRSSRHFLAENCEIRCVFSVSFIQISTCVFFHFCILSDDFLIASNIMFILLGFKPLIPDDHLIYLTSFFRLLLCCRAILFKNIHLLIWSSLRLQMNEASRLLLPNYCRCFKVISLQFCICQCFVCPHFYHNFDLYANETRLREYEVNRDYEDLAAHSTLKLCIHKEWIFLAPDSSYFTVAYLITGFFCMWRDRRSHLSFGQMLQSKCFNGWFSVQLRQQ